jgi:site-specific DNA-methyltransferase (adenine-specific)
MRQEWNVNKQKIICNDCLAEIKEMKEKSVDVVVTSPPYNLNVKYNTYEDGLPNEDYWRWFYVIVKNIDRVLKDDGSFFLNLGNPLSMDVYQVVRNTGVFFLQNHIIWVKSITVNDTSYGHFKPVRGKRFLNNLHESIFHFTKTNKVELKRLDIGVPYQYKPNIERWNATKRCGGNVWFIPYETKSPFSIGKQNWINKRHPAGFPSGLPEKCIKLHGVRDDLVVLDPFVGAGTTLFVCNQLNVNGIGIDLDEEYCKVTLNNLA